MASALSAKSTASVSALRKPAALRRSARSARSVKVHAKYGENSRYFDLTDLENTTGAWDVYGEDSSKRYPGLQEEFFLRAGEPLTRAEALRALVGLAGVGAIATFGLKGSKDASLPITKGPQTSGENGKGGSVRGKL